MSTAQKRPQSSFNYIAPLVRTNLPPVKSAPRKPAFMALHAKDMRTPRKNSGDEAAGSRSVPRMSAAAMSVQRRAGVSPRKAMVVSPGRHPGRREPPRLLSHRSHEEIISSTSEESVESDDDMPPRVRVPPRLSSMTPGPPSFSGKAARKQASRADRLMRPLGKAARKLDIASQPEVEEVIEISDSDSDLEELLDAFDAVTLGPLRLQQRGRLPFRIPNLRAGFEDRCRRAGIPTSPAEKPLAPVKVIYRYYPEGYDEDEGSSGEQECQEWVGDMTDWCCPLCQLHGTFKTRDMLAYHLRHDHADVRVSWAEIDRRETRRWRITLVLPDYDEIEESTSEDDSELESEDRRGIVKREVQDVKLEADVSRESSERGISAEPTSVPRREPLFLPSSDDEESSAPITPPPLPEVDEPTEVKLFRDSEMPEEKKPLQPVTGNAPGGPVPPGTSFRGSLPERYPSPPPPTDPLGPAAQYPFLPETDRDGQQMYSCRIGGPRIYDLLNELPLDEYGIMSWAIVDREEELFEMDDVRDEDKVMLALWNRWIMLHKATFITHRYCEGVERFLDQYWNFIHKAAGWRALRSFLLMMSVNKYLTFTDVSRLLKRYEGKTGMDLWYKSDADEEGEA
ncbi:hypothetical protein OH77DRAFT_1516923 [Trametes cingulata]|nr:hypothetical protein OH77DRAFT_1516923 [Trametes cingulata]